MTDTGRPSKQAPAPRRRSQGERTRRMQERLCVATLDVLAEIGYQRTSTTIICRRAGVSRGAQTHHFPSKLRLILAAYEHLLARWQTQRRAFLDDHAVGELSPDAYIRFLWERVFNTEHYVAALELALAARGDAQLHDGLRKVLSRWTEVRDEIWLRHFEPTREDIDNRGFLYMTICLLRGMTTQQSLSNDKVSNETILQTWLNISRDLIRPRPSD